MTLTIEWLEQKLDGPYGLETQEEIALLKAMRAVLELDNGVLTNPTDWYKGQSYIFDAAREAFTTAMNSEETKP